MRDLLLTLFIVGLLPIAFMRPWVGVMLWYWIGLMNPHRLSWGFAYNFPFAQLIAIVLISGLLFYRGKKRIPFTRETVVLTLFMLWMVITSLTAQHDTSWELERVVKTQLITYITMLVLWERRYLHYLAWVVAVSIGFYGIKGGIFTILSGGSYHVWGPSGTFIGGNNEMGLAMILTFPMLRYLQLQSENHWIKLGMGGAMLLTGVAILGTQSRGAFLGVAIMLLFLGLKSRRKGLVLAFALFVVPLGLAFMPQSWWDRMGTITEYEQDASAMGRIMAWNQSFSIAAQNPLGGGGFGILVQGYVDQAGQYRTTDAHSIYFEVLGEQGFIGLILYLLLGFFTISSGGWIIKQTRRRADLTWAHDLASMLQVSLIGYAAAGAFLGLAYFDLYYCLVAMMIVLKVQVRDALASESSSRRDNPALADSVAAETPPAERPRNPFGYKVGKTQRS